MVTTGSAPDFDERQFEALYHEHFGFLVAVAIRKFRVPESDAETLAHEVFLSYLKDPQHVRDLNKWLLGAICHASRYYWRVHNRQSSETELQIERIDPSTINIL